MKCVERGDRFMGHSNSDMEKLLSQKAIAQHGDGLKHSRGNELKFNRSA